MNKQDILDAVSRFFPADAGQIDQQAAVDLVAKVLADLGVVADDGGQQMRRGVVDIHHSQLCLMSPDGDGFHLSVLHVGQEIDVLTDPRGARGGWQRCKVIQADAGALTRQRLDVSDDAPVIGAPARVPLVLSGACAGMTAKQFPQIAAGENVQNGQAVES